MAKVEAEECCGNEWQDASIHGKFKGGCKVDSGLPFNPTLESLTKPQISFFYGLRSSFSCSSIHLNTLASSNFTFLPGFKCGGPNRRVALLKDTTRHLVSTSCNVHKVLQHDHMVCPRIVHCSVVACS